MDILNYLQVEEFIASSGQPERDQFSWIAGKGYASVINLALPSSERALADEGALVTASGMNYVHIPVEWQAPKQRQFELFANVMKAHVDRKVWVHCALNFRASCFIYLYRVLCQGVARNDARVVMNEIWECNEIWSGFVENMEAQSQ
jgi:protein tyrosine phosphatase (PTP) superfamily phosphohydrolase (DUF442 family)